MNPIKNYIKNFRNTLARIRYNRMDVAEHTKLGRLGEDMAVNELRAHGYKIAERNAKIYKREVDVIAMDGDMVVFIEVKTRSGHSFGKPLEAVDGKRRARLRKAGGLYMQMKKLNNLSIRFDIVTVDFTNNSVGDIEIMKNAF